MLFERLPLFRWDVLFGSFELLRRHAINNLDTGTATHKQDMGRKCVRVNR